MSTYNPVGPTVVDRPEREPLLQAPPSLEGIEAQDAAYAVRLNEEEISGLRRAEIEANARAWDAHYRLFLCCCRSVRPIKIRDMTSHIRDII